MFVKILFLVGLVSAGLLLSLISTTEPSSVGAVGILAVFLLGYVMILCLLTLTLWAIVVVLRRTGRNRHIVRAAVSNITLRELYYYSSVLALAPVILVSLQSVGEVGIYEIALVILFETLGCLYVSKRGT